MPIPVHQHIGTRQRPRGFTLVELLTVLAMIALLASLLFPALKGARERAYTVACANNLRQLSTAITAYASLHSGHFFGVYVPSYVKGGGMIWYAFLGRAGYLGPQRSFRKKPVWTGAEVENWRWPVLRCPAEPLYYEMNPVGNYSGEPYNNYLNEQVTSSYDMTKGSLTITKCGWCYWGNCLPCVASNYLNPNAPGATPSNSMPIMDNAMLNGLGYGTAQGYYDYYYLGGKLPIFWIYTFGLRYGVTNSLSTPHEMHAFRHPGGRRIGIYGGKSNGLFLDGHVAGVQPITVSPPDELPHFEIWRGLNYTAGWH
ncbi:type II secretion system protein [bacterium]|nr:type II secretion system protein [bacterium]